MPRVLVAGKLHESGLAMLRAAPEIELDYVEAVDAAAMAPYLDSAEAVLLRTQPLDSDAIARCASLKMVSRHGVGFDAVDVEALNARGIPLAIVGDVNARTVAEHAMLLLLAASRRLNVYDGAARGGGWRYRNSLEAREVFGKRLLIVGFGRIGRHLATMAAGFGIEVTAFDPYLSDPLPEGVTRATDIEAALAEADLISLHTPKTDRPMLDAGRIARLKPSAVVVNTARGGGIEEPALADALHAGRLHGAGLDVFSVEPPEKDNPLMDCRNAVLTPHAASMTVECAERMATVAARNIMDFFNGCLDPSLVVNARAIGLKGEEYHDASVGGAR